MARVQSFIDRRRQEPQQQEIGIGGFTALVRMRERYNLTAEVPATPVEDGSFVNDHIILKPFTLTIEGDVSDVHIRQSPMTRQFTRLLAEVGDVTPQYAPARTQSQVQQVAVLANDAADAIRRIDNLLDTGEQTLDFFGNRDSESKSLQEQFLDAMEALYFGKQVIAIDAPFRRHERMVITSLSTNYDNQTDSTSFSLEAQQIQFAELQFVQVSTPSPALGGQTQEQTSKGTQAGKPVPRSLLTNIFGS